VALVMDRSSATRPGGTPSAPSVYDLLLLAVLDGTGDLRLVRALAADRAGQGLESAERAGLVRADESTARLTFRHPLIRSAIVDLSTSEQRRLAHAALAARLAGQPERYAWHLAEAIEERVAGGGAGQYGDGWLRITLRLTILPSRTLK
jgi:hypothetical protein